MFLLPSVLGTGMENKHTHTHTPSVKNFVLPTGLKLGCSCWPVLQWKCVHVAAVSVTFAALSL